MNKDIEELFDLAAEAIGYVPSYFREKWDMDKRLETLRTSINEQPHWIPCNALNPPPANTPMLVWCPPYLSGGVRYPAAPVWVDETCYNVGEPGEAYTHYMLIGKPE